MITNKALEEKSESTYFEQFSSNYKPMFDNSWPGRFREYIFPYLPIDPVAALFCSDNGRPTIDLRRMVGLMVLQEAFNLTDNDAVYKFMCDIGFHYALCNDHITTKTVTLDVKTLQNFRKKIINNSLDGVIFSATAVKLAEIFKVNTDNQRLDSVHVKSNMKHLSRLGIFIRTNRKFLATLQKIDQDNFSKIAPSLVDRYLKNSIDVGEHSNYFGQNKQGDKKAHLDTAAGDMLTLVKLFENNPLVNRLPSFGLLQRVLSEQCNIEKVSDTNEETFLVKLKESKEISGNTLQNPSDPDATYSGHKGQGFQVQLMETYNPSDDENDKEPQLQLIIHVKAEGAHESDANALIPALEEAEKIGLKPSVTTADTAYGGDSNVTTAANMGVEVVSPVSGKDPEVGKFRLTGFNQDCEQRPTMCPLGQKPWFADVTPKGQINGYFDAKICKACPDCNNCPVVISGDSAKLSYSPKDYRLSERRGTQETEQFKKIYRKRSGIEALNSFLDRVSRLKHSRRRGVKNIQYGAFFKAIGINLRRVVSYLG